MKITVISDTHGILKEELYDTLSASDRVIHAGDIGSIEVYRRLKQLNPATFFVRGNCDTQTWAKDLPDSLQFHLDGILFYVIHNHTDISCRPGNAQIVICGHTHRYMLTQAAGRTILNPGSCSRPRDGAASYAVITTDRCSYDIRKYCAMT